VQRTDLQALDNLAKRSQHLIAASFLRGVSLYLAQSVENHARPVDLIEYLAPVLSWHD
jgi:hypothetical protein